MLINEKFIPEKSFLPFCQIGFDTGLESTSHLSDTEIPSVIGKPNPGTLLIPKEGVSEKNKS